MAESDFTCAICERVISMRFNVYHAGRNKQHAPICAGCETEWARNIGKPEGGSFMDRRMVARGNAIAEALHSAALRQKWSNHHATA
jgi:hypothetical protein